MADDRKTSLTKGEVFEALGSVFWLLLDVSWFKQAELLIFIFIPLTVATNLFALVFGERKFVYLTLNGAVNFWVMANVFWIVSDVWTISALEQPANLFFWLAMATTALTMVKMIADGNLDAFFHTFRRFRIKVK